MDAIIILTVIGTAVLAIGLCGWAVVREQGAGSREQDNSLATDHSQQTTD